MGSGPEVVLSLLYNDHFTPGEDFVILGDVCDPFHPNLVGRTLEYLEALQDTGSPVQFSTKNEIEEPAADRLAALSCSVNPLVTITSLDQAALLEPAAPSIPARLATIQRLAERGLQVFVFMRPLIPGVTLDYPQVLAAAQEAGAGVIVGSLRVSRKIWARLKFLRGVDWSRLRELLQLQQGVDLEDLAEDQLEVQDEELRAAVTACAEDMGLRTVRRACCANAFVAKQRCNKPNCLAVW